MSIYLKYCDGTTKEYDPQISIEKQIQDISSVKIDCEKHDDKSECFLNDIKKLLELRIVKPFDLKVNHNNTISGARTKKKANKIEHSMLMNWVAREIVLGQERVQKKVDELEEQVREVCNKVL